MCRLLRIGTVHAATDDALPLALELGELGFVGSELGAEFEAFRLFLGDEPEEVGVSANSMQRAGRRRCVQNGDGSCSEHGIAERRTYFSVSVSGGRSSTTTSDVGKLRLSPFKTSLAGAFWLREALRLSEDGPAVVGERISQVGVWSLG